MTLGSQGYASYVPGLIDNLEFLVTLHAPSPVDHSIITAASSAPGNKSACRLSKNQRHYANFSLAFLTLLPRLRIYVTALLQEPP